MCYFSNDERYAKLKTVQHTKDDTNFDFECKFNPVFWNQIITETSTACDAAHHSGTIPLTKDIDYIKYKCSWCFLTFRSVLLSFLFNFYKVQLLIDNSWTFGKRNQSYRSPSDKTPSRQRMRTLESHKIEVLNISIQQVSARHDIANLYEALKLNWHRLTFCVISWQDIPLKWLTKRYARNIDPYSRIFNGRSTNFDNNFWWFKSHRSLVNITYETYLNADLYFTGMWTYIHKTTQSKNRRGPIRPNEPYIKILPSPWH